MYLPDYHKEDQQSRLHDHIRAHPFGSWACMSGSGLVINHLPFVLDQARGSMGVLRAHIARANTVWQDLDTETETVVAFLGQHSYITPNWYPSKARSGKVVPTWDYTVVHARGCAQIIHDRAWILQLLNDLTKQSEHAMMAQTGLATPWQVADAPEAFIERLLNAVVGIEIPINSLQGRWKVSQDEATEDRIGTADGLERIGSAEATALAGEVRARIPK